jgi:cystathionine beta-synthase
MRERGFLDDEMTVANLISRKKSKEFMGVQADDSVRNVFNLMKNNDISQMPVLEGDKIVGSITETHLLHILLENPLMNNEKSVRSIMGEPFPVVAVTLPISQLNKYINKDTPAVITYDRSGEPHIVTQYDLIQSVC